jgi:hypothetical protein
MFKMSHKIKNIAIVTVEGESLKLPVYDYMGQPVYSSDMDAQGNVKQKYIDANLHDCLNFMVRHLPKEFYGVVPGAKADKKTCNYTLNENTTHANKLASLSNVELDEEFELGNKTYDWAIYMLRHGQAGSPMFNVDLPTILEAMGFKDSSLEE